MRISDVEPSSVILSQRKKLKNLKNNAKKVPEEDEAKMDGAINPQNFNFNQFLHRQFKCSQSATNQPNSTVELGKHVPS